MNVPSATIDGVTYNFAGGNDSVGTIEVGAGPGPFPRDGTRQIQGLSAGRIASDSTDGINGSQLYATHQAIEAVGDSVVRYDDNSRTQVTLNPGGSATTITNVAPGDLSAGSTDAVNGGQLFETNTNVTNLGNTLTTLDNRVTTINDKGTKYFHANSTGADSRALGQDAVAIGMNAEASGTGNVAIGANSLADGATLGASAYRPTAGAVLAGTAPVGEVSVGSTGNERRITHVAAGAGDTDAVNVSQLKAVVASATSNAVQYDDNSRTQVTLNPGGSATTITNVAPGDLSAGSTDAVNGGQLFETNTNVTNLGNTLTTLDNRVTTINDKGTKYFHANSTGADSRAVGEDSVAIGMGAIAEGENNVALGSGSVADGSTLSNPAFLVGGTATSEVNVGGRRITGVAAGAQDDDAANIAQLRQVYDGGVRYDLNPDQTINYNSITLGQPGVAGSTTIIHNVAPGVAETDAVNVSQLTTAITMSTNKWVTGSDTAEDYSAPTATGTNSTAIGSGATSTGSNSVALGDSSSDGGRSNVVSVGSSDQQRQIINVAAGSVNATSTDAINGGQLHQTNTSITQALGGGSTVNEDGTIHGPTYNITTVNEDRSVTSHQYSNVGDALGGLSTSVVNLNDAVTNISGGKGIKYFRANSTHADATAAGQESTAMGPQASAGGNSALAGGDRATAGGDGSVAIGQQSDASATGAVAIGQESVSSGSASVALGQQSAATGASSIAIGQSAQASNAGSIALGLNTVSGGLNTVAIGTGAVATNSVAVGAGAQAGGGSAAFGDNANALNASLGTALGNGATVTAAAPGGVALGSAALADRAGLAGQREAVSGVVVNSTQGAVSVGSAGAERQITHVAGGTQPTDAVNLRQLQASQSGGVRYDTQPDGTTNYNQVTLGNGQAAGGTTVSNVAPATAGTDAVNLNQLNAGLAGAQQYADRRFDEAQGRLDGVAKDASAAAAGAMAMANLPQASLPGKSMISAGVAGYDGQAALAIGVSKLSDNARWIVKFSGTANSRGKVGVAAGVGFHW